MITADMPLNFCLKSGRDYVQGPDIYFAALRKIYERCGYYPRQVMATFHKLLKHQGIFRYRSDKGVTFSEDLYARFIFTFNENRYDLGLYSIGKPITSTRLYDEEELLRTSEIVDKSIRMLIRKDYTYMEQIVSMTKKLHHKVYPQVSEKWLFTKIQIKDLIDPEDYSDGALEVRTERKLQNILSQCAIFFNDRHVGDIFFSVQSEKA